MTHKTKPVPIGKGVSALREYIKDNWTIREILHFKSFTHGGTFSAPDNKWSINYAGYVAASAEGMRNLVRLFDSLHAQIWSYIGAVLFASMNAKKNKVYLLQNVDDLMDMTINALTRMLSVNPCAQYEEMFAPPLCLTRARQGADHPKSSPVRQLATRQSV